MSHLVAISVGPVQEFIAAARRTRDLWFGSYLLSEVSRAVARSVEENGGKLIFPADVMAPSVANVILAELEGADPAGVAAEGRRAAQACWESFAEEARRLAGSAIREQLWEEQVGDVIEFYAAWVRRSDNYRQDRKRVMRLLAGRKNLRDFAPAAGQAGIPKSSLDGQRESVLQPGDRDRWPKALRLSPGEQLDVVGVTKRVGKMPEQDEPRYPSVSRIAADPWLRGLGGTDKLARLKDACQPLSDRGLLRHVDEAHYRYFPFEGAILFKTRHPDLCKEFGLTPEDLRPVADALDQIGREPSPYLAVLVADGDRMGQMIDRLPTPEKHREFSQQLAQFAAKAAEKVAEANGVLVYAGGDDVLAFVPVDGCLDCARRLHDAFAKLLEKFVGDGQEPPTLSVGIAIVHFMENLEDQLGYARAAEQDAKRPDRDGLAVHLYKRGGAPIRVRAQWGRRPDERLKDFARMIRQRLVPTGLPYELLQMSRFYQTWGPAGREAIQRDLPRLIAKKQSVSPQRVQQELGPYLQATTPEQLLDVANEMLIARVIAAVEKQAASSSNRQMEGVS